MRKNLFIKSMLCLLLGLVCNVAWAQTGTDGPIVTFTNVQQDGTTYTLYINDEGVLATSTESAETLSDAARFRLTLQDNGKYTFYNESKELYMIWRANSSGGFNSNKGVLDTYDPTYCDWTVVSANSTKSGTYYLVSKRDDGTKDGSLIIMDATGNFDGWGNSVGWSDTYSNLYRIEGDEYTATLTDAQGTEITCSTKGFPTPTYSDATFSDIVWKDGNLTATVSVDLPVLAFPVSSTEETNATFISSFKSGDGNNIGRFKWYAENDDVKIQRGALVSKDLLEAYSWAIYPSLENGTFAYSIKNVATGKYIYTEASYSSNGSHTEGTVTLGDTPTKFLCSTDGENRLYYVSNSINHYLSYNSVNDATGYVGIYTNAHDGTTNAFHTITYSVTDKEDFVNGGVYTFVSSRGWMGATESCNNVISTVKTSHGVTGAADNNMFQWTVYKSNNGNYYLYNIGKQQFMGVQSSNNSSVPFAEIPQGKKLTFKESSVDTYPFMLSTDNAGVVNHSADYGDGLITWTGGWDKLDDAGSNHQVTYVSRLPETTLQEIAAKVEAYDKVLPITTVVTDLDEDNPNTHFGSVRATNDAGETLTKLLRGDAGALTMVNYDGTKETTIDFTREYRGFEFQGYWVGEEELGKSFTLTEELKSSINDENPLIAKFTATDDVTLFYDDDEFSYRIPAIATTSTGRLIAVSDYRHCLDDIGMNRWGKGYRIDLVIRTSDDNGKTWSPIKTIAEGIDNSTADDCAYGDAAIAVVGEEVIVMAVAGSVQYGTGTAERRSRVVRVYSANNGEDWEKTDITEKVYGYENALYPTVYTAFFGSGKLAVDPDFNESGEARIYGSLLTQGKGNQVIYSDDKGLTWYQLGTEEQVANANEPKVEILPSGQILLSARRSGGGGRVFNVFTYTDKANNTGTWSGTANGCDNGGSNGTNGEIFCVDAKKPDGTAVKLLLQSQPKGGSNEWDRKDVTIWYKEIDGTSYTAADIAANWTEGLQVSNQKSAYSAMTMQEDGKVAFFFEEAPCYQDRNDWGYSMVYAPLTIENITKGNYFSPDADLSTNVAVNVVLTDAEGNEYRDQLTCALNGIAAAVTAKYPFITLGDNTAIEYDGESYTYTNSVTLPFKVSNEDNTVWYNIYWHGNNTDELVYLYGGAADAEYVAKVAPGSNISYGNSNYNTAAKADNMSWAVYHAGNLTFTLKNKLTNKYIKVTGVATNSNNNGKVQNVTFVEEGATAFEIVTEAAGQNYKGDYSFKATVNEVVGYLCNTSASYDWATHYNGNSHEGGWATFKEAPDFAVLIDEVNSVLSLFGEGLGEYTPSDANAATLENAKTAMQNSGSVKLNDLKNYNTLFTGATLNLPVAGQFFRIKAVEGWNNDAPYLGANNTTVNDKTTRAEFVAEADESTIFYYDGTQLVSYKSRHYLLNNNNFLGYNDNDVQSSGTTFGFAAASNNLQHAYNISFNNGGRWLYCNTDNYTDAGSSRGAENGYCFNLEEVTALPVTISSVAYGTLYAPAALQIPEHVKAYTGALNDDNTELVLTKITTGIIPAETGVVLYRDEESYDTAPTEATTHDFSIVANPESSVTSSFSGSVATIARTSVDGEAYTLQEDTESAIGVAFKPSADNIAGGKAYLVLPTQQAAKALRIRFAGEEEGGTTSIDEGQLTMDNGQLTIYDLQGRRVLNPTKGMYIVNGKKVLF